MVFKDISEFSLSLTLKESHIIKYSMRLVDTHRHKQKYKEKISFSKYNHQFKLTNTFFFYFEIYNLLITLILFSNIKSQRHIYTQKGILITIIYMCDFKTTKDESQHL
jgi:hypothetical protein